MESKLNRDDPKWKFVDKVEQDLVKKTPHNKRSIEKLALSFGIADRNLAKELTELAIVRRARSIVGQHGMNYAAAFHDIVDLYYSQVNLSHRTSQSILLQQYSTPAPIGYLAGLFVREDFNSVSVFEPSAGNGLLTIAGHPFHMTVNEIDPVRRANLETQTFKKVFGADATIPFINAQKAFDAVITNPPFGTLEEDVKYDTFPIKALDHLMALRALDCMKDNGRAAFIIGGHARWDELGRIKGRERIFFNYLYSRYNVVDIIYIDGKLYSRQGTSFNVRLVLIDGRKTEPKGAAPLKDKYIDVPVTNFADLYERVMLDMKQADKKETAMRESISELEQEALQLQSMFKEKGTGAVDDDDYEPSNDKLYRRYKELKPVFHQAMVFMETPSMWLTFDDDAILFAKALKKMYISYEGPKLSYTLVGFSKVFMIDYLPKLKEAGIEAEFVPNGLPTDWKKLEEDMITFVKRGKGGFSDLGAPYAPASDACVVLDTQVPDSMSFETQVALEKIKDEVGGDIDAFVRHRLGYRNKAELCDALSAEQTDAVAMAIYNIEARQQGMIIGDQTGIGKGRVAAAIIRYAVYYQKVQPVFITEKANLFSDIYRDLLAIGSSHLIPFIVNGRESKTDIKDEDGEVVHEALPAQDQQRIFQAKKVPANFHFVLATYSQFNSPDKKPEKPAFLTAIAQDNIFIMDEAHNSSGSSNTGNFMQSVAASTKGIVFLSATFAKRPDNMPIYAMKTCICDANMGKDELVSAITSGGVALQEVLASQLVAEGQMLRRERSFEGVEVNYITLEEKEQEHRAIADNITEIIRDIIAYQTKFIDKEVDDLDKIAAAEGKETKIREGTSQAGVDNQPYFSKVFNVINQMLFSIKAEAVAERAIVRLKEGKKPVIAFASTMGSFIEQMETDKGMAVTDGDIINADFAEVLKKGIEGVMKYTVKDVDGNPEHKTFLVSDLSPDARKEYERIMTNIKNAATGICISPIDIVIKRITEAGYTVAEVTGRKYEVQLNDKVKDKMMGLVLARKRINTNDAFRLFNNNEVDVLMINQSGSTGASAHAVPTAKVPRDKVKQRVMIVLQAELDINTEVQKRGRINRTGQILKPIYDYVNSAIPAEKRLMMMLQKKLKSLDANTTSNQKQSSKILDVPDFLNKYGDKMVKEYLIDNPEINKVLGDPIGLESTKEGNTESVEDAAHKVSGRVAVLSTKMQQSFYTEISERYNDFVEYLKQVGEYDLEVEDMNLEAEMVEWRILKLGKGGESAFGDDSILETVKANVLKKPFSKIELENLIKESLDGKDPLDQLKELRSEYEKFMVKRLKEEKEYTDAKYDELIKNISEEKKIQKIEGSGERQAAIKEREKELEGARVAQHSKDEVLFSNRRKYLDNIFGYFYVSRKLNYPVSTYEGGQQYVLATFLGFIIDRKKKNPFSPSNIRLRFAIATSNKYIALPASYSDNITSIIGATVGLDDKGEKQLYEDWEKAIKANVVDRKIRHIITGNLLQAYGDHKGKLVSYTTNKKETKKGILMPESWTPVDLGDKVVVPIMRALTIIKSLSQNAAIFTSNDVGIFRYHDDYKIIVASSRQRGGEVYLEKEILDLVENHNFDKVSDKMMAILPAKNLQAFVEVLQRKMSASVTISFLQFDMIKDEAAPKHISRVKILLPTQEEEKESGEDIHILELEAEALVLEMELMAA
jgi:predicted RNA methylase